MIAPLTGQAFTIDAAEVHTFIVNFITQNVKAESIIKIFENERNGHKDWITLKNQYEGQVIYANDISKAETDLKNLFCAVKKKPHMWWIEFERRLNRPFLKHYFQYNIYVNIYISLHRTTVPSNCILFTSLQYTGLSND